MKRLLTSIQNNRLIVLILILVGIGLFTHGFNVNRYPAYFDDEGTYMAQAWAVVELGQLAPYTYWYDHAPLGWLIIAGWVQFVGGFFTFGTSIDTGRVFMVLLHGISTALLFFIVYKVTRRPLIAAVASLLFSLSPMAVTLQRMIFLDNIMMPFLLLSFATIIHNKRLLMYVVSGLSFGFAVMIKETAVFLIPAYIAAIFLFAHRNSRLFAFGLWFSLVLLTSSIYFLYALLKGELFPYNSPLGGDSPHVSLIETLKWQATRDGGFFLSSGSEFQFMLKNSWLQADMMLLVLGTVATLINAVVGIRFRTFLVFSLFPILYIVYLIRGGIVNDQYIIPLIPFFAMNIALTLCGITYLLQKINISRKASYIPTLFILAAFGLMYSTRLEPYMLDQTSHQVETIEWIKQNTNPNDLVVVDAYGFVDLREGASDRIYAVSGVQHYWKIDSDPRIREQLLENDFSRIDYVVATPKFERDVVRDNLELLQDAIENSDVVAIMREQERRGIYNKSITTMSQGGDIHIYKLEDMRRLALTQSWDYYKTHFIKSYGQVVDPASEVTTSEGQSYAMLRSVWLDDQTEFDGVWQWTKDHLQHREEDLLLSWIWEEENGEYQVTDPNTASDADQDIALALLFAYNKWGDETYYNEAQEIIADIWEHEVTAINGQYYLLPNTDAQRESGYLINPSYLSPATYKIFASVDPQRPWNELADDSYDFLTRLQSYSDLPPNWVMVDGSTGAISSASDEVDKADVYGYDAFRTMWRVALDYHWFQDERAKTYLENFESFYQNELEENGQIAAEYTLNGKPRTSYAQRSTDVAALSVLSVLDPDKAREMYNKNFYEQFNYINGYWSEKENYYSQNWAWFGTALYSHNLPLLVDGVPTQQVAQR